MAGVTSVFNTGVINSYTAAKTIGQIIAPTNQRLLLAEFCIAARGVNSSSVDLLLELLIQTSAGTGLTTWTPQKLYEGDDETLQATGLLGNTTNAANTAEPSGTTVRFTDFLCPYHGKYTWAAYTEDRMIPIKGGTRLGFRVTAGANVELNLRCVVKE